MPQVIAPALNELSAKMADTLSIGSYPVSAQRDGAGIVISLEGTFSPQLHHIPVNSCCSLTSIASTRVRMTLPVRELWTGLCCPWKGVMRPVIA